MSTRTLPRVRGDWILFGALGCALVGTAYAEYILTVATGVHPWVAASVPGALDLYVIRALQVHRDVLAAVLAMVVMNVASHLVTAGVLPMHWGLISAVGALAPLVLWRIHYLFRTQVRVPEAPSTPGEGVPGVEYTPSAPSAPAPVWDADYVPAWVQESVQAGTPSAPVPEVEYGEDTPSPEEVLKAEYDRSTPEPEPMHPDAECVYSSDKRNGGRTSLRALKAEYSWGQIRATEARRMADEYIQRKQAEGVSP